jgi:hypothetical protein
MRRLRRLPPLVIVALLATAAAAGAAGVTVGTGLLATATKTLTKATCTLSGTTSTTDTYVNESNKTQTNGTTSSLVVENLATQRRRAFVRFDFSKCPSATNLNNAQVDSATLTLQFTSATGTPRTLNVYRVTATWASSINWNTQPAFAGSATSTFSLPSAAPGSRSADVTQDVNDVLQSTPVALPPYGSSVPHYGWVVVDQGTGTGVSTFNSSESGSTKPTLTINYAY